PRAVRRRRRRRSCVEFIRNFCALAHPDYGKWGWIMGSRIGSLLVVFGVSLLPCLSHAQTYSKTETIEYSDNLASWVLGQVKRTTTNGVEDARTDYDSTTALPLAIYSFGRLQQSATTPTVPLPRSRTVTAMSPV